MSVSGIVLGCQEITTKNGKDNFNTFCNCDKRGATTVHPMHAVHPAQDSADRWTITDCLRAATSTIQGRTFKGAQLGANTVA